MLAVIVIETFILLKKILYTYKIQLLEFIFITFFSVLYQFFC